MGLSKRDIEHVFDRLRSGVVPERGLDTFAVGIDRQRGELHRLLDMAKSGEGVFKFLRGGYGCGKTFMARLAVLDVPLGQSAHPLPSRTYRFTPATTSIRTAKGAFWA